MADADGLRQLAIRGIVQEQWRALEIFLYDWRLYDRLSRMAVRIVYTGTRES